MKLFKFTNRNYRASDTWRMTLQTKEEKKAQSNEVQVTNSISPMAAIIQTSSVQHVICTAEALKKSAEEKLQIQQVHDEIEKIRLVPELAI